MRTIGLMTRAAVKRRLQASGSSVGFDVTALEHYIDSLGFRRALLKQQIVERQLLDNLIVLGMVNVILFHWYWYVLVEPLTYLPPWSGYHFGDTVPLPKLPVAEWVTSSFRVLTQEWANGVFIVAAIHTQPPQELVRFTWHDAAIVGLYFYVGLFPMLLSFLCPPPWDGYVFRAETIQRWFLLVLTAGKGILVLSHRFCFSPIVQLALLVIMLLLVPPCFEDLCGHGGEFLLPTDWWPKCAACLVSPKELVCILLYVGAAHARELRWLERGGPLLGLPLFLASSLAACWMPGQAALSLPQDPSLGLTIGLTT